MGEGDMVPDKPESLANGNAELEEKSGLMDNKQEHHDEVTEMKEDKKDSEKVEAHNMDVGEEINKTEEIEETVKDGEAVKEGEDSEGEKENKEEDKQAVVEEGKVEAKDEVMDDDVMGKTQETGDKVEEEVDEVEDEERSEEPKPEKALMKKRPRTKNDVGKKDKIKKKEPVDTKQKPKTSNEKKVEEHETSTEKKEDPKTPVTYTTDRPVRERKSVERLVATIEKDATKEFHVEKGRGTALKDIPNVAYKLSKKKNDDTFRLLHNMLFGRRGKALEFKNNMSRFSGFVWHDNEEKQTIKVKEKLDKIVKEKLVEFCDVLDIPVSKANTRKEDIIAKLIEFLMAPNATTTEVLADKEQSSKGQKRKRVSKSALESSTPSKGSAKSSKKTESTSKKGKETKGTPDSEDESEDKNDEAHEDEDTNGVLEKSEDEDEMSERAESEEKNNESEESDEEKVKQKQGSAKSSVKKGSTGKAKTKKVTISKKADPPPEKAPVKSPHSRTKSNKSTSAKSSSGKKKDEIVKEKTSSSKKSPSSASTGKKVLKGKDKLKEAKVTPSDDELRNAICELLKEVDFNTATFTDVLKLLAKKFSEDLTPRKSSIKLMIQEELTKLADSEDDEGDAEKDGKESIRSVKA
ncbi:DEK domain-containing chromatin-associated protein 4-like [Primulina tabacum]|uniref:DEK domain-containing chromatin-associated protein 4-like n=1 Tax=Primulina tabacum TaxID=48773 RepID=UPI003F5AA1BB